MGEMDLIILVHRIDATTADVIVRQAKQKLLPGMVDQRPIVAAYSQTTRQSEKRLSPKKKQRLAAVKRLFQVNPR
jgi:hypothetical protein